MSASGPGDATDAVTAGIQALFRLGSSRRIFAQQTAAAGISLAPQALRVLERVVEEGETTPGELSAQLDLDPATVTRLLRSLEESGLVRRGRRAGDARVSTADATVEGRETLHRYREVIWDQVRRTLSRWPAADVAVLADLLDRLVHDVQQQPYRPVGGTGSGAFNTPSG